MKLPHETLLHPDAALIAYRDLAIPKLRDLIAVHAARIARGRETQDAAVRAVWNIADDLGAGQFSSPWRLDLLDWIKAELDRKTVSERAKLVREAQF